MIGVRKKSDHAMAEINLQLPLRPLHLLFSNYKEAVTL